MKAIITNVMYVLLPILGYFFKTIYDKKINNRDSKNMLEISLILSFILAINYGDNIYIYNNFYLANIPLLICYLKKRNSTSLLISLLSIIYAYYNTNFNIYMVILNYVSLFIIYKLIKKYFIYYFVIINIFFLWYYNSFQIDYLLVIMVYLFTLYVLLYLFDKYDKSINYYMSLQEISTNKKLQESLFKISHEIKNPIAVCKGYLELMDGSIENYNKYIPIINNEINHSLSILKDFSSIGKLRINLDIMDISLLLEDVLNDLNIIIKENNIDIEFYNIYDELYVNGDYLRLKEVLINVIKNSIEALRGISNPKIKILLENKNNTIIIKVIDNGCGIDNEGLNKISQPFFTTKKDGTGLGTYLSKEIIDAHKGKIEYYSACNNGMEVIIKLKEMKI